MSLAKKHQQFCKAFSLYMYQRNVFSILWLISYFWKFCNFLLKKKNKTKKKKKNSFFIQKNSQKPLLIIIRFYHSYFAET